MIGRALLIIFVALFVAGAAPAPKVALAPSEIVAAAPAGDWVAIAAADLLVMDLATGKRVVIQLMPPPISQAWVGNIRKLAAAHWWDGTSINRVQDNYVVQWGDANGEDKVKAKGLPTGLSKVTMTLQPLSRPTRFPLFLKAGLQYNDVYATPYDEAQFSRILTNIGIENAVKPIFIGGSGGGISQTVTDPYARVYGWVRGMPLAVDMAYPDANSLEPRVSRPRQSWPVHCYGMVGVGRGMPPDTGTGAELYTVIGHAPRHLDRNIALVGRVISGIEHLSSLPRGTGPLGFYEKPAERVTITSIRIGTEVKDLPRFEYLSTETASFAAYADARANRRDPFFIVPAGGADICNIPVPVRMMK